MAKRKVGNGFAFVDSIELAKEEFEGFEPANRTLRVEIYSSTRGDKLLYIMEKASVEARKNNTKISSQNVEDC